MKRTLQILAAIVAVGVTAAWLGLGANRGWTKTSVEVRILDEITGIEEPRYVDRFVPGVDFLGAGLLAAGLLAAGSLFAPKSKTNKNNKNQTQVV